MFSPVKEKVAEAEGALGFVKTNQVYKKEMTVAQFRALALDPKYALKKPDLHGEALEKWVGRRFFSFFLAFFDF